MPEFVYNENAGIYFADIAGLNDTGGDTIEFVNSFITKEIFRMARSVKFLLPITLNQIMEGNTSIIGLMVESHIGWGNQSIPKDLKDLQYGVSVTDACIDWDTTVESIRSMHAKLKDVLPARQRGKA